MNFLVIPLCERKMFVKEVIDLQKSYKTKLQIVLLCEKNHPILKELHAKKTGVLVDTYPVGTLEDEMVSTTLKSLPPNGVILVRGNCQYFSTQSIDLLLEKTTEDTDIALFQNKKPNKIKSWLLNLFKKMCKFFFNFTFFEGNISMMYFSPRAHLILTETNASVLTKINRWIQIKTEYVQVPDLPQNLPVKTPKKIILKIVGCVLWIVAMISLLIFLPKMVTLSIVFAMLLITGVLLGGVLLAYTCMQLFCHKHIGAVHTKNIEFWERREF